MVACVSLLLLQLVLQLFLQLVRQLFLHHASLHHGGASRHRHHGANHHRHRDASHHHHRGANHHLPTAFRSAGAIISASPEKCRGVLTSRSHRAPPKRSGRSKHSLQALMHLMRLSSQTNKVRMGCSRASSPHSLWRMARSKSSKEKPVSSISVRLCVIGHPTAYHASPRGIDRNSARPHGTIVPEWLQKTRREQEGFE